MDDGIISVVLDAPCSAVVVAAAVGALFLELLAPLPIVVIDEICRTLVPLLGVLLALRWGWDFPRGDGIL